MSIPIIIGVTGHRDLRGHDIPSLRALVRTELAKRRVAYPRSPFGIARLPGRADAKPRNTSKNRIDECLTVMMFILSLLILAVIVILEFPPVGITSLTVRQKASGDTVSLRRLLLILVGAVSAATAFLSHFYGKLSLGRKVPDNEKMILFDSAAQKYFDSPSTDTNALFWALARDELMETGNRFSYCRENKPTFDM